MSGIVGSRLNIRGSGVVGKLGTDGQVFTSAGAGKSAVYEDASGFDVTSITGATDLAATPATTDEFVLSDAGTLKRLDYNYIKGVHKNWFWIRTSDPATAAQDTLTKIAFNHTLSPTTDPDSLVSSSTWTCPTDGDYFFYYNVSMNNSSDIQQFTMYHKLNDSEAAYAHSVSMHDGQTLNQISLSYQQVHAGMSANDTFDVFMLCHSTSHTNVSSIKITGTNMGGWKL